MGNNIRLVSRKVTLGKYYWGVRNKSYRCVMSSPKGINFLDETTNKMLFKRSLHAAGWTGKPIPKSVKEFKITAPDCILRSLSNEVKKTKD